MQERTDAALLNDVKDLENCDAWRRFLDRYQPLIYGCCRGIGMDPDEAREMTSEVLEKLVRKLPQFDYAAGQKPGKFRAWLRQVTKNAVIDRRRRQKSPGPAAVGGTANLEAVNQVPMRDLADADRLSDTIEEALAKQKLEHVLMIREAIRRVQGRIRNPKRWEAFWGILQGRSSREVADQLGMSVAAVLVAAKEMPEMLKEEIAKLQQPEEGGN